MYKQILVLGLMALLIGQLVAENVEKLAEDKKPGSLLHKLVKRAGYQYYYNGYRYPNYYNYYYYPGAGRYFYRRGYQSGRYGVYY